jgi:glyoxylase-like metal-dependent hydrolase (beta-lactamase superfamily II)
MQEDPGAPIVTWARGPVTVYFGADAGKYPDGNQVVVRGTEATFAFDMPQVAQRLPQAVIDEIDAVVLGHVHEDHMAGLSRVPQVPVHVHAADVEAARSWEGLCRHYGYAQPVLDSMKRKIEAEFHYRPRPDALRYADGAVWELGRGVRVRAVHMPGHTAGHAVLLVEPEGVAFIGDIEMSGFGPYYGDATSDLGAFRRTLARLPELPATAWITSHHKGIYTERAAFLTALAAFAARIDEREAQLLRMLERGTRTLADLAQEGLIYRPGAGEVWVTSAEARSIVQHLDELAAAGRVRSEAGRYALA